MREDLNDFGRALCWLPTGSGKTVPIVSLCDLAAAKGLRVTALVNRRRLVKQLESALSHHEIGVCSAAFNRFETERQITLASIQTIYRRDVPPSDLIIIDEVHDFDLDDGMGAAFLSHSPQARIAGFTATPWRKNRPIYGEKTHFPAVSYHKSIDSLIAEGFLTRPTMKGADVAWRTDGLNVSGADYTQTSLDDLVSDKAQVRAQVMDALPRLQGRRKVVWICANIDHAKAVRSLIQEESCIMYSGHEHNDHHDELFESTDIRHMVSVMMLTTGYDFPAIDAVVLMRPTRSVTLYVQAVGRALRRHDNKQDALILDYGRVVESCGPLNRPFVLDQVRKTGGELGNPIGTPVWVCKVCLSMNFAPAIECVDCGSVNEHERKIKLEREHKEAQLIAERQQVDECPVLGATLSYHESKSGNDCILIMWNIGEALAMRTYVARNEYFWKRRNHAVMKSLGLDYSFDEIIENLKTMGEYQASEYPKKIKLKRNGKYPELVGVE